MGWFSKDSDDSKPEHTSNEGGRVVSVEDHPDKDGEQLITTADGHQFETQNEVQQQLDENSGFGDDD